MINFVNTCFFLNHHYFWNLFAFLLAKYVTGGLFDKRNEGSFFTWGFRLHGYVYPRHCRKRAIVLHCTQHETRLSDSQTDLRTSTQKGPKRVWKLLPSVSESSIKNGRSSSFIVFLRNELDTWAIAFLAKPSSTPNRSDLIDWNRMLTSVNLKKTGMACRNIVIKKQYTLF